MVEKFNMHTLLRFHEIQLKTHLKNIQKSHTRKNKTMILSGNMFKFFITRHTLIFDTREINLTNLFSISKKSYLPWIKYLAFLFIYLHYFIYRYVYVKFGLTKYNFTRKLYSYINCYSIEQSSILTNIYYHSMDYLDN